MKHFYDPYIFLKITVAPQTREKEKILLLSVMGLHCRKLNGVCELKCIRI